MQLQKDIQIFEGYTLFWVWYNRSNDFTLCAYTDVDQADNMDDIKRIIGGAFFLGGRLIYRLSKKQDCISYITLEEEYVASTKNYNQIMWMKQK